MNRRDVTTLFCGTAVSAMLPFAARAQQMPVIGYLGASSRDADAPALPSMHAGLKESGFVEGQNVTIEYRWADGRYDRLRRSRTIWSSVRSPSFAPSGTPAALAAKAATARIPIVFTLGSDPVAAGLVASLARPGGNATGVSILVILLSAKRLEVLRTLLPQVRAIAVLVNPRPRTRGRVWRRPKLRLGLELSS